MRHVVTRPICVFARGENVARVIMITDHDNVSRSRLVRQCPRMLTGFAAERVFSSHRVVIILCLSRRNGVIFFFVL